MTEIEKSNPHFEEFFILLALCHTVMPEEKEGMLTPEEQIKCTFDDHSEIILLISS